MTSDEQNSTLGQLALINRVTMALAGAVGPDDVARAIVLALTSPLGLRFSRAFVLRHDSRRECFTAEHAGGLASAGEAHRLYEEAQAERRYLDRLDEKLPASEDDNAALLMEHLKSGALLIDSFQQPDSPNLDLPGWEDVRVVAGREGYPGVFESLFEKPSVLYCESESDREALPRWFREHLAVPFVAFSVHTSRGGRLAILADRLHQRAPGLDRREMSILEWFSSQVGMAWSEAELVEDLEIALSDIQQLDSLKSHFLATISHELRTPLTVVLGFLDLVVSGQVGPVTDAQEKLLERSRLQANHLLGLVNDLLTLAEFRTERGGRRLAVGPVEVRPALEEAIEQLAVGPRAGKSRVSIRELTDKPLLALANQSALQRILYHLLDNAVKFGSPNGDVEVELERVDGNCHVSVIDRGIGIERSKLSRIFSLFYQVDARLTRAYPGMGIGLSLVKFLLDATGGHIVIVSKPKLGSTFTVVYPSATGEEEKPKSSESK